MGLFGGGKSESRSQEKRLKAERQRAEKEASKLKKKTRADAEKAKKQRLGRLSLIRSGGELGVTEEELGA